MPRIFQAILLFVVNSESLEEIYQQNLKNEKKKKNLVRILGVRKEDAYTFIHVCTLRRV